MTTRRGSNVDHNTPLVVAVAAVVVSACLPLARVFIGLEFLWPVVAAALLAVAVGWACRRIDLGPALTLVASILAWAVFVGLAFLSETLLLGLVPTPATFAAGRELWVRGLELVQLRPSPTYAEAGLLLLAVNGVWAVTHAVDGLVFRLQAPVGAVVMALVLWTVPLTLAPPTGAAWLWALPFLAASAGLLLASAGSDLTRFGRWVHPDDPGGIRVARNPLVPGGAALAGCAIVLGSLVAGSLPGFGQGPWYQLRGLGGTTLTSNPIVGIQQRLVATDPSPVLQIRSERPVYIRTTSLDVYGEREEWTNDGISGEPVGNSIPIVNPIRAEQVAVDVEVLDLPNAVLVPLPYQTAQVSGGVSDALQYDQRLATFTLEGGQTLQSGDTYSAFASIPSPSAEELDAYGDPDADPALVALPANVPPQVGQLAREIVAARGATSQFQQALALQDQLRTWTYSLEAPPGHSGSAMSTFLETRSGYCEQFAGTMAVMLRSLGIPARVAVGFTPGTPLPGAVAGEPTTYSVSLANAHAWVEVDFGPLGWIAFEPTPRSDGNVLVPSAANLAPDAVVAQVPQGRIDAGPQAESELFGPRGGLQGLEPAPLPSGGLPAAEADGAATASGGIPPLLLVLAGLVGVGAVVAVARGRRSTHLSAVERVLAARARVGRLGTGLGIPARPWETDAEYLSRLAGAGRGRPTGGDPARQAALTLSGLVAQARWAPALAEDTSDRAETAAGTMSDALLDGLPAGHRALARVRGPLILGATAVTNRIAGLLSIRPVRPGQKTGTDPGRRTDLRTRLRRRSPA